jgi:hypothetical protein
MGLKEKTAIEDLQTRIIPSFDQALLQQTGSSITFAIAWDTFSSDLNAINRLKDHALNPILSALRELSSSKVGKETVASEIKKVVVKNGAATQEKTVSVKLGVLEVTSALGSPTGAWEDSDLQTRIEAQL